MTRGIPSRPALAAMLVLAMAVSFSLPAGAAPSGVVGAGNSTASTDSLAGVEGPGSHFGFSSVLGQLTATQTAIVLTQTVTSAQQTQVALSTPGLTGAAGQPCGTTCTFSGGVNGSFVGSGAGGSVSVTATTPAGALLNDGAPILFVSTTAGVERLLCQVPTTAGQSVSCTGNLVGTPLQGATATVRFAAAAGPVDVTGTVSGTGVVPGALTIVKTGPATTQPGQTITYTVTVSNGGVGGVPGAGTANNVVITDVLPTGVTFSSATVTAGGSCTNATNTVTCTVPTLAAGAAGAVATINAIVNGNNGGSQFGGFTGGGLFGGNNSGSCSTLTNTASVTATGVGATTSAPVTTTCNPIIIFPNNGFGNGNFPLLPPPPLEFIPPPPPPLLPPPPPAPMAAARPVAAFPDVPVIPEADSLFLLVGGLAALGGLVGFRSLRRRHEDDSA